MRNDLERYVIEVNGIAKAEYPIFVKALKASLQLRQELPKCRIKLRDAYQCQNKQCGIVLTDGQVDHKIALAFGGSDDDDNLQYLCKRCNQAKGLAESRGVQLVNPSDFNPDNARRVKINEGDSFFNIGEAFSSEYGRGRVKA